MSTQLIELLAETLAERYAVDRQIGRGGMATVYLARDRKHEREVAVKVLHPEFTASIGAERFLREIRLAATLQHPHVLGLYDSGSAGGMLFYVMPFIEGESLRDRLRRESQLPIDTALRITGEVANALAYAHARGVVHRDIKPENILLSNGHAVVADFGIARAVSSAADKLTETGMAVGTPQYMSPEQGMGGDVGPSSDVYALGCMLYEMLAGEAPFTGPNAMAIIAKHAMADPPSVRVVRPSVGEDVDYIVRRALAKSPADRWPDAAAMEKAIAQAAANTTASFSEAGAWRPTRTGPDARTVTMLGIRVRRRIAAVLAGVAVVAAAGGLWWRAQAKRPAPLGPETRRIAVLYFDAPRDDAALAAVADGFTENLTAALMQVPSLATVSPNGVLPFRGRAVTLDSVARALHAGTLVTGKLEHEAGDRIRVTLSLRDASGAAFGDTSLVRPAREVLRLREDVIDNAATLVRRRLGEEVALRASRAGTEDPDAWALYQRGVAEGKRAVAAFGAGDSAATVRADGAADSLLALSAARDAKWTAPTIERARLAYLQSRRRGANGAFAAPYIARSLALVDSATARGDSSSQAIGLRGIARYWQWLLHVGSPDLGARQTLAAQAQADLERAVAIDPGNGEAWNMLSHYYSNFKTVTDAKLAAKKAWDIDPYLSSAEALLWRLYATSYQLAQFDDARRYCAEFGVRFPKNPRRAECRLWLLSVPDAPTPTPAQAWALAGERDSLAPPAQRGVADVDGRVAVAAALARAGMSDSAKHVAARALGDSLANTLNPDRTAWVLLTLGDRDGAYAQLKRFVAEQGTTADQARRIVTQHWWWQTVRDAPEFRAIFGI